MYFDTGLIYKSNSVYNWWNHCGVSGIGSRLGRNRLWVRFLAVSDIFPMFIEPTITWVPSGFSGYIWLDTKIVLKKKKKKLEDLGILQYSQDYEQVKETYAVCSGSVSGHRLWFWIRPPGFESWVGVNILWGFDHCTGLTRAFIPPG